MEGMRYLGCKQPYADLMLHGKIETRTWNTNYRGLVLITASKASYPLEIIHTISGERQYNRIMYLLSNNMKFGYAIAVGRLVDCRKMLPEDEDKCFVEYHPDLWCHIYEEVKAIEPIEFKGSQGWRKLDQDFIKTIKYL